MAVGDAVVDTQPARSGVTVAENRDLVPFDELMRQLEERRALEYMRKRELEQ